MKILAKIVVGWKIGKGNKASMRADHDRALTFYRSAIEKASGSGYEPGEILARLSLVSELEETGAPGELAVPELERLVALSRTTDRVPMIGRTARIRMEALEALVSCAVESGDRSVEAERRAALAEAAEELGERGPWIDALRELGTFWAADDAPRSAACFERALEVCALVADKAREAEVLGAWSVAAMEQGDRDRSGELAERSIELQRATGVRNAVGTAFARFDDSARRAVVRAKESAAEVSAPAIQVEHLLHALLQDDVGPCPALFQALGADQAELIAAAAADRERGDTPSPAPLPFSEATRAVLQRADRMAEQFESVLVSTAHMLLALLDVIEGKSPQLPAARGIGLAELRKAVEQCSATRAD